MHNQLHVLALQAANPDFAALCNLLSFFQPGDEIDVNHCASVVGISPTMCAFYLDTIAEVGAVIYMPPDPGLGMRAAA